MPMYLLVDNGSVQAAATLQLRKLARGLSEQTGKEIHPVSLMHANRIDADKIGGEPATIFVDFMREALQAGEREFVVVPLFFGESRALTASIPEKEALLREEFGDFALRIADVVYPLPEGEQRLADIVLEHTLQTFPADHGAAHCAALVDHGSPIPQVTAVRQHLAEVVKEKLGEQVILDQAVMERREGKEYDFNGMLLADYLSQAAEKGVKSVAVIMMFFLPGRHAGEGGDVVEICQSVMDKYPGFVVSISPLISEHPLLLSILADRMQ